MIAHNYLTIGKEELAASKRVLQSGWLAQGREVRKFEDLFCDFLNIPHGHAVAISSGTSALFLALNVLDSKGKKIGFPSYVCSAVRNAVNFAEGIEDVIDSEYNSPNISIEDLNKSECSIAIVPHMFGIPVDINKIKSKLIIEDCCQSLGAKYNGKSVGINGDIGIYSFYASKLITSGGQGGMVVSMDKCIIDEIIDYRDFDMRLDKKKRFNFQMTDLQAAIGIEQLKKLPQFIARRKEIFNQYLDAGLSMQLGNLCNSEQIYYRAVLKTKKPTDVIEKLAINSIKSIIPIEDWELLSPTKNALNYTHETVSLPIYPSLTNVQLNKIINAIK